MKNLNNTLLMAVAPAGDSTESLNFENLISSLETSLPLPRENCDSCSSLLRGTFNAR